MAVNLAPIGNDAPFTDGNGNPLSGGLLYTYTAGSSTPQTTFTTEAANVQNSNPIELGSTGYPSSGGNIVSIWLTAGVSYKFTLKTSAGVDIWTRDNIDGINDTTVTIDQWVSGPAPTYIGATSFSLVGDQTSTFHVGRRLKTTNTGGTIYSVISASVFGAVTTVTIVNDSGTLDSGLSAVSYGLLSSVNPGTPVLTDAHPIVSGSADKTKKVRLEVDGLTTATTRVLTVQDSDDTLVGRATTDTLTNKTFGMGTGVGTATPVGVAHVNTTAVGNVGAGDDNLMSYVLPANSLSANGKAVRLTAWGRTANNANAKAVALLFNAGGHSFSLTTSILGAWEVVATIVRTGSGAQDKFIKITEFIHGSLGSTVNMGSAIGTFALTDTADITIQFTGTATSDDDIIQEGLLVEFLN